MGTGIRRLECVGNLEETFIRGADLTRTTTVGNDYEDNLVINGNGILSIKGLGTGIRRLECVGNHEETFIRGADLTRTTTVGQNYEDHLTVTGNKSIHLTNTGNVSYEKKTDGNASTNTETKGNVEENYMRHQNLTINSEVGTNLTNTTTVGNDYEDHLTVTGHKKIVSKTTGGVSHDYFNAGEGIWKWVTMGDLVQNYTRNKDVTTTLNVGTNLTNTTTVGENYVDNFTVNGNITENRTIIGDVTKTVEQSGTTVVSYKNNNQLVKTVSSKIDPNDSNIIGVQNSEIIESGEIIYKRVKGVLDKHEVVDNYKHTLTIKNGADQDGTMETYKYKKLVLSNGETLFVLCLDSPQI